MSQFIEFDKKVSDLDPRDKGLAYLNFGNELIATGMDPTIPAVKALHLFKDIKDGNGVVQASILIANHLFKSDQHVHALNYLLDAKQFLGDFKDGSVPADKKGECYLMNKIGFMHFQLKEHAEAIDAYLACVDMLEVLGDFGEVMKIYGTLGFIYQDLCENDKANEMFAAAARLAKDAGNDAEAAKYTSFIS